MTPKNALPAKEKKEKMAMACLREYPDGSLGLNAYPDGRMFEPDGIDHPHGIAPLSWCSTTGGR